MLLMSYDLPKASRFWKIAAEQPTAKQQQPPSEKNLDKLWLKMTPENRARKRHRNPWP